MVGWLQTGKPAEAGATLYADGGAHLRAVASPAKEYTVARKSVVGDFGRSGLAAHRGPCSVRYKKDPIGIVGFGFESAWRVGLVTTSRGGNRMARRHDVVVACSRTAERSRIAADRLERVPVCRSVMRRVLPKSTVATLLIG